MTRITLSTLSISLALAGCVSPPSPDPRPPLEQQVARKAVDAQLQGTYEVVGSMNDLFNGRGLFKVATVEVRRMNDAMIFALKSTEGKPLGMYGTECSDYDDRRSVRIHCRNSTIEFASISLEQERNAREIKPGGMITFRKPIQVQPGDHTFSFIEMGPGRVHEYVLRKKSPAATQ